MPGTVQSVERAFAILELFSAEAPTHRASSLAADTGLSRPTVYRLLATLQQLGFVRHVDGHYELTSRVLALASGYGGALGLGRRAQPTLDRLSDLVQEYSAIAELDGNEIVITAKSTGPGSRFLAVALQVGQRAPAEKTSLGRILLAHRPTPHLSSAANREATKIRDVDYVVTEELLEAGLVSIGVPVRDQTGAVVASICVACSAGRVLADRLAPDFLQPLRTAAEELTDLT